VSQHREGFWVVTFPAELARAQPVEIRRAGDKVIEDLMREKPPHCLVDLSAMQTLGSSCVASIVRIWKAVSQFEGQMVVVAPSQGAREVLRVTGLSNIWTVAPTLEAGIHVLGFSKEAKVVKRERRLLVMVSAFSLLNAAAAVTLRMLPQLEDYTHPNNTLVFSILILTVLTSTICLFRERGWRLWLSIFVFLASLFLSGLFIWHTHYRTAAGFDAEPAAEQGSDPALGNETAASSVSQDRPGIQLPTMPPPASNSNSKPETSASGSSVARQPRTPDLPSASGPPVRPGSDPVSGGSTQPDSDDTSGEEP